MNSILFRKIFVSVIFALIATGLFAQSPKRDIRATWLSTAWRLDWPASTTVPTATGTNEASREASRNVQKSGLISVLDKLKAANFNTLFFQVRPMSDAFYNSAYEPWSQFLSSERGSDPGYDPLAFAIEEAHKRGIELHAWLNPYRYSSSAETHGNLPTDYAHTHPDWLLDYGGSTKILNPAKVEVRQRICDVVADILSKYDVDGIVFDDYFYAEGTTDVMDNEQYLANNPNGLSRGDWRRENVNQMIREVYARINSLKPYVTFGISPAGVAASNAAVAAKYGVEPSPGSDWQYNGIYSDPLAWVSEGTIDYISPQIYWGGSTYAGLSPWWSKVTNKFGRHFYSSNTSSYSNATTELPAEVIINRDADLNGVTGTVYFRTNNLAQSSLNALKANVYQNPALRAAYGWKTPAMETLVSNMTLNGQNLSWDYTSDNVRYSVYAIPNGNRNDADAFTNSKYLQGVSYAKTYTLPENVSASTHKIAVAIYDRYGYEYPPRVLGENETTTATPVLIYPANESADIILPAVFTWEKQDGVSYYIWEVANDASFTKPIASYETTEAEFNSAVLGSIQNNTFYYWRIKAIKPNAPIATSAVWSFNGTKFSITSPTDASTGVSLTPTITWKNIGAGASYTLEVSNKSDFSNMDYTLTLSETQATIPSGKLAISTTYYTRVYASRGTMQAVSERVTFKTEEQEVPVPIIISPSEGATVNGTSLEICWQQQPATNFRVEISQDASFPSRSTKIKTAEWDQTCTIYDNLATGTWYARVKAGYSAGLTNPSATVSVFLNGQTGVEDIESTDFCYAYYDGAGTCKVVINSENSTAKVEIYSTTGILLTKQTYELEGGKTIISPDIANFNKGIYLIRITTGTNKKTIKVTK